MWTDFRVKFLRFFRKYKIIIFIIISVVVIVKIVNQLLKNYEPDVDLSTSYEPHTSVIDETDTVPTETANEVEELIAEYVGYCNEADFVSAYNMLSSTCKKLEFNNSLDKYMAYVYTKMPTPKKYSIQNYSNDGNIYIYQVKYTDDMLATGLTNSTYSYTEEKMVFTKTSEGIEMAVGEFIEYDKIENVFENEYVKIDIVGVVKYYSIEKYYAKITNRSNYTIVIKDGQESKEVLLKLNSGDVRELEGDSEIILKQGESIEGYMGFDKYYDNGNDAKKIVFDSIRVMEKYSGTDGVSEETIEEEKRNAISKFSASIAVDLD